MQDVATEASMSLNIYLLSELHLHCKGSRKLNCLKGSTPKPVTRESQDATDLHWQDQLSNMSPNKCIRLELSGSLQNSKRGLIKKIRGAVRHCVLKLH